MVRESGRKDHRVWRSSWQQPGPFKAAWVGDNPTYTQRRAYILAYFKWHLPPTKEDLLKMEHEATWEAVEFYHDCGRTNVGLARFRWRVDQCLWHTFFRYFYPNNCGAQFPWPKGPAETADRYSTEYTTMKQQMLEGFVFQRSTAEDNKAAYDRAVSNRLSMPRNAENAEAKAKPGQSSKDSSTDKHDQGSENVPAASFYNSAAVWKEVFSSRADQPGLGPFEIMIPAQVDFEYLVTGPLNRDLAFLNGMLVLRVWKSHSGTETAAHKSIVPELEAFLCREVRNLFLDLIDWSKTIETPQAFPLRDYLTWGMKSYATVPKPGLPPPSKDEKDVIAVMAERKALEVAVAVTLAGEHDVELRAWNCSAFVLARQDFSIQHVKQVNAFIAVCSNYCRHKGIN
ncbi:hypothetical protein B0T10DRAFT_466070 [Thelonectria olida]|uniref:Uncharacterized protein n=1 Tax=Thelonectria olida TaxID=1576542 RepID=A0A9P9AJA8_9HYPO|nr:hypothetical protein B0T10DRAFT_466070 [Thelonectria olida]